ncbi:MAG: hypothetical protein ACM3PT_13900 [Deltaproteobacteria bacterium]
MKKKIKKIVNLILLSIFFGGLISPTLAQKKDIDNFTTSFNLTSVKQEDNTRLLTVEFTAINNKNKKDIVAVVDAELGFYNILDDKEILIGKSKTDKEGIGSIVVPAAFKYLADEEGYITVVAKYEGNDVMTAEESELIFKDIFLEIQLKTEDSMRTVVVNAYNLNDQGEKLPVETLDIALGVKGLLSDFVLDENTLENGLYEYELPEDIHGNSKGELTLFVKLDEHEDYGNVYKTTIIKNSYPNSKVIPERNKLWTQAAPVWMYVVLTIMLVGVWSNYLYSIINLIKISKMGKP